MTNSSNRLVVEKLLKRLCIKTCVMRPIRAGRFSRELIRNTEVELVRQPVTGI